MKLSEKFMLCCLVLCVSCDSESDQGEASAGEMTSGEMSSGETPAGEAPAGETPAGETPAGETPAGETPAGETPAGETPAGEAPAGETPAGETPAGETPAGETPAGETPAGETPAGETPAGETLAGETPAGETPAGETPAGETPAGETPAGETPSPSQLTAQELDGAWTACRSETARSLTLIYEFTALDETNGTWRYEERRHGEEQCLGDPSITIIERGAFEIGQALDSTPRVHHITLSYETRSVTANNQNSATLLSDALCPDDTFPLGEPVDISESGCERLNFTGLDECSQRYDLITLMGDEIAFGVTPDDSQALCVESGRPLSLGEGLLRQ